MMTDEHSPPPASNAGNGAPLPSEADYGAGPPPTDEALGLPADIDTGRPDETAALDDDDSLYGHTQEVIEPKRRFPLTRFDQIQLSTAPSYLVKGLIPRQGLVVIGGPPKCGKSFWAFDVAAHIALGWSYRDRKVRQGAVVYLVLEGEHGIGARVEAFRQHHLGEDADPVPLYLLPTRIDLIHEYQTLIDEIGTQTTDNPPALIVIDTLNRSLSGSESRDEDMGAYIKAADAVREAFGAAVAVVHHCGIEGSRPRGHTSLTGAADAQIAIKRDIAGVICATVEWMKDGPEGTEVHSKLNPVAVGTDDDGEPITSRVIVEAEPAKKTTAAKLTKNQETMLGVLDDFGPGGATVEEWNAAARQEDLGVKRKADLRDFRKVLKDKQRVHTTTDRWYVTKL